MKARLPVRLRSVQKLTLLALLLQRQEALLNGDDGIKGLSSRDPVGYSVLLRTADADSDARFPASCSLEYSIQVLVRSFFCCHVEISTKTLFIALLYYDYALTFPSEGTFCNHCTHAWLPFEHQMQSSTCGVGNSDSQLSSMFSADTL